MHTDTVSAHLHRLNWLLRAQVVEVKLRDLQRAVKAGFEKVVEIFVDREMCPSCEKVLPYIGLELGNPTVTFIDSMGRVRIMRDGYWIK